MTEISGTLIKIDSGDGKIHEALMTEYKGIPKILGMGGMLPDYCERIAFAVRDAVQVMSDNDTITSIHIMGIGTIYLAQW